MIVALGVGLMWMIFVFGIAKYAPAFAGGGAIFSLALIILFSAFSTQKYDIINNKVFGDQHMH